MVGPSPVYAYSIAHLFGFVKGFPEKSLGFFRETFIERDLPERDRLLNKSLSLFRLFRELLQCLCDIFSSIFNIYRVKIIDVVYYGVDKGVIRCNPGISFHSPLW